MPWVLVECPPDITLDIALDTRTHAVVVHAGEEYFFILVQYSSKATTKFLGVFRGIQASSPYLHGACSRPRRRRILVGPAVQGGGARTSAYRAAYQAKGGGFGHAAGWFWGQFYARSAWKCTKSCTFYTRKDSKGSDKAITVLDIALLSLKFLSVF